MPSASCQMCVTSPPYWGLRDYGIDGQLGLETSPDTYVMKMVAVFREAKRVLKDDGTLWLNLGDSYASDRKGSGGKTDKQTTNKGSFYSDISAKFDLKSAGLKAKDLVGIPWRVAFALQQDGWYLRQDIIWHKPNVMPESIRDRCTKAHEYIFLLAKSERYYFDHEAIKEPAVDKRGPGNNKQISHPPNERNGENSNLRGSLHKIPVRETRNRRSVWTVTTKPFKGAHFATFPPDLIEPCILAGSRPGDVVLDPFAGAGTTGVVCKKLGRNFLGVELNPEYREMALERIGT